MFNPAEIIIKKRDGHSLTEQELSYFLRGYLHNSISDYQMSALLMAIFFQGMKDEELMHFTELLINSGDRLSFSQETVDKHSTGGVGDKISLMLAPVAAECGAVIPMISGRGLGHTGGTLDKLEAVPGFRTNLTEKEFRSVIHQTGFSIISQSERLVPLDKKIYALRDVTGTVESLPLITASIISKKIAEGAKNLVIDLKTGTGAFITDLRQGRKLGKLLKSTGEALGQKVEIIYSNMNSPLGRYIGNAVEVRETITYLKGEQIPGLDCLVNHLAVKMLLLSKVCGNEEEAEQKVKKAVESGRALNRFAKFIKAQGGNEKVCDNPGLLPTAKYTIPVRAKSTGWVNSIDCRKIGYSLININAGRKTLESKIDHSAGACLQVKIGDYIHKDDIIGKIFCNDKKKGLLAAGIIGSCYAASEIEVKAEKMILHVQD